MEKQMIAFQEYIIHLTNGDQVLVLEDYDLEGEETLISKYSRADANTMFCVGDKILGRHYFKGKDIVQISEGDVKIVDEC